MMCCGSAIVKGGPVVDFLGRTPGDISLSINDEKSYVMIRNEGLRTGT
jgi:hypothetical protein